MKQLLLLLLFPITCLGQDIAFAELEIDPKGFITLDFGEVQAGTEQLAEAIIVNNSDKPLAIGGFTTTCGCTAPIIKKRLVLPGEYTTIGVSWGVHKDSKGLFRSYGKIASNAQNYPVLRIKLTAEVIPITDD